jgi:hypothetical protein
VPGSVTAAAATVSTDGNDGLMTVHDALAAGDADGFLRLEDAGEGVQPLRLLECGHVFHVRHGPRIIFTT